MATVLSVVLLKRDKIDDFKVSYDDDAVGIGLGVVERGEGNKAFFCVGLEGAELADTGFPKENNSAPFSCNTDEGLLTVEDFESFDEIKMSTSFWGTFWGLELARL